MSKIQVLNSSVITVISETKDTVQNSLLNNQQQSFSKPPQQNCKLLSRVKFFAFEKMDNYTSFHTPKLSSTP